MDSNTDTQFDFIDVEKKRGIRKAGLINLGTSLLLPILIHQSFPLQKAENAATDHSYLFFSLGVILTNLLLTSKDSAFDSYYERQCQKAAEKTYESPAGFVLEEAIYKGRDRIRSGLDTILHGDRIAFITLPSISSEDYSPHVESKKSALLYSIFRSSLKYAVDAQKFYGIVVDIPHGVSEEIHTVLQARSLSTSPSAVLRARGLELSKNTNSTRIFLTRTEIQALLWEPEQDIEKAIQYIQDAELTSLYAEEKKMNPSQRVMLRGEMRKRIVFLLDRELQVRYSTGERYVRERDQFSHTRQIERTNTEARITADDKLRLRIPQNQSFYDDKKIDTLLGILPGTNIDVLLESEEQRKNVYPKVLFVLKNLLSELAIQSESPREESINETEIYKNILASGFRVQRREVAKNILEWAPLSKPARFSTLKRALFISALTCSLYPQANFIIDTVTRAITINSDRFQSSRYSETLYSTNALEYGVMPESIKVWEIEGVGMDTSGYYMTGNGEDYRFNNKQSYLDTHREGLEWESRNTYVLLEALKNQEFGIEEFAYIIKNTSIPEFDNDSLKNQQVPDEAINKVYLHMHREVEFYENTDNIWYVIPVKKNTTISALKIQHEDGTNAKYVAFIRSGLIHIQFSRLQKRKVVIDAQFIPGTLPKAPVDDRYKPEKLDETKLSPKVQGMLRLIRANGSDPKFIAELVANSKLYSINPDTKGLKDANTPEEALNILADMDAHKCSGANTLAALLAIQVDAEVVIATGYRVDEGMDDQINTLASHMWMEDKQGNILDATPGVLASDEMTLEYIRMLRGESDYNSELLRKFLIILSANTLLLGYIGFRRLEPFLKKLEDKETRAEFVDSMLEQHFSEEDLKSLYYFLNYRSYSQNGTVFTYEKERTIEEIDDKFKLLRYIRSSVQLEKLGLFVRDLPKENFVHVNVTKLHLFLLLLHLS